jgi:hypothetical protein
MHSHRHDKWCSDCDVTIKRHCLHPALRLMPSNHFPSDLTILVAPWRMKCQPWLMHSKSSRWYSAWWLCMGSSKIVPRKKTHERLHGASCTVYRPYIIFILWGNSWNRPNAYHLHANIIGCLMQKYEYFVLHFIKRNWLLLLGPYKPFIDHTFIKEISPFEWKSYTNIFNL